MTIRDVEIKDGIVIIEGNQIPLKEFKDLKEQFCYYILNNDLHKVAMFSEESNFYYKLLPTGGWPTITLSSTPMHRYSKVSPKKHAGLMVKEISPVRGKVLDTCCGLGYTAIISSKNAEEVHTFEIDPYVQEIAKFNPYSQEIFASKIINVHIGDINEEIIDIQDGYFDRVIHDPPTPQYAQELYSLEFHKQLFRVMKNGGILYHYVPQPGKQKGNLLYPRIIRQLKEVGFKNVEYHESSSGIRTIK